MSELTDTELIKQVLDGDIKVFGVLIRRYQDAVYAVALHYTMNFADAQDVSQEAFIDAYQNLRRLSEPDKFPSWLHTITIRQYHRLRRKQHGTASLEEIRDIDMIRISNEKVPLPHEDLERNELRNRVLDAIASLPQEMGEVVTMHYIDGLQLSAPPLIITSIEKMWRIE